MSFRILYLILPFFLFACQTAPKEPTKTWVVRYQNLPQVFQGLITAEWSYAKLSGKEDSLLTKDLLVINRNSFVKKRTLEGEIEFPGLHLQSRISVVKNPNHRRNGPEYLPHYQLKVNGKDKADFTFGDIGWGYFYLNSLVLHRDGIFQFGTLFRRQGFYLNNLSLGTKQFLDENEEMITDRDIQGAIKYDWLKDRDRRLEGATWGVGFRKSTKRPRFMIWTYPYNKNLGGQEKEYLKKNQFLITLNNFSQKLSLENKTQLSDLDVHSRITLVQNPDHPKQGPLLLPRLQLQVNGKPKADFLLGRVGKGRYILSELTLNSEGMMKIHLSLPYHQIEFHHHEDSFGKIFFDLNKNLITDRELLKALQPILEEEEKFIKLKRPLIRRAR